MAHMVIQELGGLSRLGGQGGGPTSPTDLDMDRRMGQSIVDAFCRPALLPLGGCEGDD
jgi:hypothetical protein